MTQIIIATFLLLFSGLSLADEENHLFGLTYFIDGFQTGNTHLMGITAKTALNGLKEAAEDSYQELFLKSQNRQLNLRDVHWKDHRITADFYATVDGVHSQGSLTIFTDDLDQLTRIESNHTVFKASHEHSADAAQMADKVTSAVAVGGHAGSEMNPLMAGLGPIGFIAVGGGMVAMRQGLQHNESLHACISGSQSMGGFGWGAATNNMMAMAGLGPLAVIGGIGAGSLSYTQTNYKGDCEEGPMRFLSLSVDAAISTPGAMSLSSADPEVKSPLKLAFDPALSSLEKGQAFNKDEAQPKDEVEGFKLRIEASLKTDAEIEETGDASDPLLPKTSLAAF